MAPVPRTLTAAVRRFWRRCYRRWAAGVPEVRRFYRRDAGEVRQLTKIVMAFRYGHWRVAALTWELPAVSPEMPVGKYPCTAYRRAFPSRRRARAALKELHAEQLQRGAAPIPPLPV